MTRQFTIPSFAQWTFRNLTNCYQVNANIFNANVWLCNQTAYSRTSSLPSDQEPLRKHRLASMYTFNNVFSLNYINNKPINSTAGSNHTKKIKQILFGKQNS